MLLNVFANRNFGKFPYDISECGDTSRMGAVRCCGWENAVKEERMLWHIVFDYTIVNAILPMSSEEV